MCMGKEPAMGPGFQKLGAPWATTRNDKILHDDAQMIVHQLVNEVAPGAVQRLDRQPGN